MKRVISLALCLMLVFSLAFSVSADTVHNHTITIHNSREGYVYDAYQIFSGELGATGVLSDIDWGTGVNGPALLADLVKLPAYQTCKTANDVATVLAGNDPMDDPDAVDFAELARMHLTDVKVSSTWNATAKNYTITGLDDGYYFVNNPTVPDGANTTHSRYIMEVVRDIGVTHKGSYPTVDKTIVETAGETTVNDASIGEGVNYKIVGTLPSRLDYYSTYYYAFTDTLSKGLTYDPARSNLTVTVNGVDVTDYFHIDATDYEGTDAKYADGTSLYVGIQDLLALELLTGEDAVGDITKDTQVVLTYTAFINTDAVVAVAGNPNKVKLVYDNNPNKDGSGSELPPPPDPDKPTPPDPVGETPESEVETWVTELTILKKDGSGNALAGAEFELSGDAVYTTIVTREAAVPAAEGETATHWELKIGTFTSTAPVFDDPSTTDVDEDTSHGYKNPGTADAPAGPTHVIKTSVEPIEKTETVKVKAFVGEDGYLTFTGLGAGTYTLTETTTPNGFNTIAPITFEITFNKTTKKFEALNNSWIMEEPDNTLYAEVINVAGTTLPSTGGIGTTLFYVFGGILFAGAAVLLVTKKRMNSEG